MHDGGVAQLGEHLLCKQGVVGSIPSASTMNWCREGWDWPQGRELEWLSPEDNGDRTDTLWNRVGGAWGVAVW